MPVRSADRVVPPRHRRGARFPRTGVPRGRLEGLQFGDGIWPHVVLAPGTLQVAFAEATNPPRAHTSSRETMKVFLMTISIVARPHQRFGDLSAISGTSGIFRSGNYARPTRTAPEQPPAFASPPPRRSGAAGSGPRSASYAANRRARQYAIDVVDRHAIAAWPPIRKGPESPGETLLLPKMGAERTTGYGSPTSSRDNELATRTGELP